jgi:poly-gamma-glutamate synthesis protein (capsule biosynthesis protein)
MKFLFVGDVMLGRLVNEALQQVPSDYPWGDTLPLFHTADVRICNLECVLSDNGAPWTQTPKVFHFRSDSKNVATLKAAGIDFVSLANNHTLDYGYDAMFEMLDVLDREAIHYAGAGRNLAAASRPTIFMQGSMRIGCIAFTDNEPSWEASSDKAGVFHVPVDLADLRARDLLERVAQARAQVDWLIVCAHWGSNWGYEPEPPHIPFAHALIDNGADIIFGHSCHVFQGIELYHSRPILYSCGDYVDDYRVDEIERNDQSFIFILEADQRLRRLCLYPTVIRRFQARLAEGDVAQSIALKMQSLCSAFNTDAIWESGLGYLNIPIA